VATGDNIAAGLKFILLQIAYANGFAVFNRLARLAA
jgi:hypothetical protein